MKFSCCVNVNISSDSTRTKCIPSESCRIILLVHKNRARSRRCRLLKAIVKDTREKDRTTFPVIFVRFTYVSRDERHRAARAYVIALSSAILVFEANFEDSFLSLTLLETHLRKFSASKLRRTTLPEHRTQTSQTSEAKMAQKPSELKTPTSTNVTHCGKFSSLISVFAGVFDKLCEKPSACDAVETKTKRELFLKIRETWTKSINVYSVATRPWISIRLGKCGTLEKNWSIDGRSGESFK